MNGWGTMEQNAKRKYFAKGGHRQYQRRWRRYADVEASSEFTATSNADLIPVQILATVNRESWITAALLNLTSSDRNSSAGHPVRVSGDLSEKIRQSGGPGTKMLMSMKSGLLESQAQYD